MVSELKEIITSIERLEEEQQRQIAKMLKDEIDWDTTLENSQHKLKNLAQETLRDYKNGNANQNDW